MKHFLVGSTIILLLLVNTIIGIIPMMVLALLKLIIPNRRFKNWCFRGVRAIALNWSRIDRIIFHSLTPIQWDLRGDVEQIRKDESVLVICNHQSWVDIPALMALLLDRAPFYTFFLKRELLWVPFLGLAWWALEYPFMRRYGKEKIKKHPELRGKDMEITRKACAHMQGRPVSLINFLEGTRFTREKHQRQSSPYRYLLKPKCGGMSFALSAMAPQINQLLDVTVVYETPEPPSFWAFLSGQVKRVIIDVTKQPIPEPLILGDYQNDNNFRIEFRQWVNQLWTQKDERIAEIRAKEGIDDEPNQSSHSIQHKQAQ